MSFDADSLSHLQNAQANLVSAENIHTGPDKKSFTMSFDADPFLTDFSHMENVQASTENIHTDPDRRSVINNRKSVFHLILLNRYIKCRKS